MTDDQQTPTAEPDAELQEQLETEADGPALGILEAAGYTALAGTIRNVAIAAGRLSLPTIDAVLERTVAAKARATAGQDRRAVEALTTEVKVLRAVRKLRQELDEIDRSTEARAVLLGENQGAPPPPPR